MTAGSSGRLSQYRLLDKLGQGGMGVVYRGEDLVLHRPVALKFLTLAESGAGDELLRERFIREARTASALNHPNICTIYQVGEVEPDGQWKLDDDLSPSPGTPYIVMEFIEGKTLDEWIRESGARPLAELVPVALQVAEGLAEAHGRNIVHRDLKPGNVMIGEGGRVKIVDFGLARVVSPVEPAGDAEETATVLAYPAELTTKGSILGTVAYMSPEQARGQAVDPRSDVFSFGTLFYKMLTGELPFRSDSTPQTLARIIETDPKPLVEIRSDVPLELERIVHRCLRKQPGRRYNDTRDLVNSLRELNATLSTSPRRQRQDGAELRPADARRMALANWCAGQSIPGLKTETPGQILDYVIRLQEAAGGWPGLGDHWSEVKTACILKSLARLSFDAGTRWSIGESPSGAVGGVRGALDYLLGKLSRLSLESGLVGEDLWDTCQVLLALAAFGEAEAGKQYASELNLSWDAYYRNAREVEPRISWTGPAHLAAMGDVIVAYRSLLDSESRIDDLLIGLRSLEHRDNGLPVGTFHAHHSDDPAKHRWNTALVLRSLADWPSTDLEMIARAATWVLDQLDQADRWLGPTDRESPMYLARCLDGLCAAAPRVSPALAERIGRALEQGNVRIDAFWSRQTGDLKAYSAVIEYLSRWTLRIPAGLAVGLTLSDPGDVASG